MSSGREVQLTKEDGAGKGTGAEAGTSSSGEAAIAKGMIAALSAASQRLVRRRTLRLIAAGAGAGDWRLWCFWYGF